MPHDETHPRHHHDERAARAAGLRQEIAWTHPEAGPAAPIDIEESDDEVIVRVDLPGVDEQDLVVSCDGIDLTVRGERKPRELGHVYHRERLFGPFERTLTFKHAVDQARMHATYRAGVLEIRLPRAMARAAAVKVERGS